MGTHPDLLTISLDGATGAPATFLVSVGTRDVLRDLLSFADLN